MSAGELSDHFAVSKPTMSAHFSVLQHAGLIEAEKNGRTIVYRLKMSVLEEALLGFAQTVGWDMKAQGGARRAALKSGKRLRPLKQRANDGSQTDLELHSAGVDCAQRSARRRELVSAAPERGGLVRGPASSNRDDAGSCPRFARA